MGESAANSSFLPSEFVPDSESKKIKIPARKRQEAVTEQHQEKITHKSLFATESFQSTQRSDELESATAAPQAGKLDPPVHAAI